MDKIARTQESLRVILVETNNLDTVEAKDWSEVRKKVWTAVQKRKFISDNSALFGLNDECITLGNVEIIVIPEGLATECIIQWWKSFTPKWCVPIGFTHDAAAALEWANTNMILHSEVV